MSNFKVKLDDFNIDMRTSFIRSICERPEDDTPRLIFADWLEDHGGDETRAEFIRFGCSHPYYNQPPSIHWINWPAKIVVKWRRGFIASISLTLDDFMQHALSLFREHPITEVRLTDRKPYVSGFSGLGVATWYDACGSRGGIDPSSSDLPTNLFLALSGEDRFNEGNGIKYYDSLDPALAAISLACVTYGRKLVGLPPL